MKVLCVTRVHCAQYNRTYIAHGRPVDAKRAEAFLGTRTTRGFTTHTWALPSWMPHECDVPTCQTKWRVRLAWSRVARAYTRREAALGALSPRLPRELVELVVNLAV
jgi:hypothetical protein